MIWLLAAVLTLMVVFVCLWRFRFLVLIIVRETGLVVRLRFRLAGFLPFGGLTASYNAKKARQIMVCVRLLGIPIRITVPMKTVREYWGKRRPTPKKPVAPAAFVDIMRRAIRLKRLEITIRDFILPLDTLCIWSGIVNIINDITPSGFCCAVRLDRERESILKIRLDLVMNLILLSKIGFRSIRKKVRSWSSTPLKTSCSRP